MHSFKRIYPANSSASVAPFVPQDNADPTEDPFEKASEGKRERVAKNELQRLRNIARNKKVRVPAAGMGVSAEGQGKEALKAAANQGLNSIEIQ